MGIGIPLSSSSIVYREVGVSDTSAEVMHIVGIGMDKDPELPRTLYSAFGGYEGTLEEALRTASPLHLVEKLPKETAYYIFHCEKDRAVNKGKRSDPFVAALQKQHTVTYYSVPDRGHCDLTPEMWAVWDTTTVQVITDRAPREEVAP